MSLTGWGLPVLLSVLAAVTLAPLVLGLPRRNGAREASLRAAQLLVFTLSVLLLAGLGVTSTQKLFATGGDLKQFVVGGEQVTKSKFYGGAGTGATAASPSASASESAAPSPTAPVIPDLPPLSSAERDQTFTVTGAVTAFSAGGWCAAYIGMKNPAQFGAAQVFGGYVKPLFAKGHNPLTAEHLASPDHDLAAMAGAVKPPIAIWTQTARGDSLSSPSTSAFLKAVQAPTSATDLISEGGGRAYYQWRPHVQESLAWLGRTLPGFALGR